MVSYLHTYIATGITQYTLVTNKLGYIAICSYIVHSLAAICIAMHGIYSDEPKVMCRHNFENNMS